MMDLLNQTATRWTHLKPLVRPAETVSLRAKSARGDSLMKTSRFSESPIVAVLQGYEAGTQLQDLPRDPYMLHVVVGI